MRTVDLLRLAAGNLRENPLRTALCALSVAVGAGALLLRMRLRAASRGKIRDIMPGS